jgi:hypothetical protein
MISASAKIVKNRTAALLSFLCLRCNFAVLRLSCPPAPPLVAPPSSVFVFQALARIAIVFFPFTR